MKRNLDHDPTRAAVQPPLVPCQVGELPSFAKHLGTEREPAGQTLTRRILQQQ